MTAKIVRLAPLAYILPFLILLPGGTAQAQQTMTATPPNTIPTAVAIDQAAITDPVVRAVYANAKWRAIWSPEAVDALDTALAARDRHGLDHVAFETLEAPDASEADRDIAHTQAAIDYARALANGRIDPASLHQVYTLPRAEVDLAAGLWTAIRAGTVDKWLGSLAPQDAEYQQLSEAYRRFSRAALVALPVDAIPAGVIRVGDRDARVAAIAEQLKDGGYLPATDARPVAPVEGAPMLGIASSAKLAVYTPAMAAALKGLQTDYGITADGVVGPETLNILNLGAGDRARSLAVALERRRWLTRTPPVTRIDVNTAAAQLYYYRDGTLRNARKVVVGEPGHETPPLSSPIFRLVANPTWTVPKSIQNGEMANVDADYLEAHNMILRDGWIVQQPGPDNALGLVKFDMANDQAIYLHDTSAPALFERSQRHLSHGCVRIEDALGFAEILAEDEGVTEAWQTAQASGEMTYVPLPTRIPVRLLYHTVFVDTDGAVAFRTDPYGWNDPVAEKLGFAKSAGRRADAQAIDIGP